MPAYSAALALAIRFHAGDRWAVFPLYYRVAAVFIAQVYGLSLTLTDQLGIVLTVTLASIGTAAVPGAGLMMLSIVLQQAQIPVEGIALILEVIVFWTCAGPSLT